MVLIWLNGSGALHCRILFQLTFLSPGKVLSKGSKCFTWTINRTGKGQEQTLFAGETKVFFERCPRTPFMTLWWNQLSSLKWVFWGSSIYTADRVRLDRQKRKDTSDTWDQVEMIERDRMIAKLNYHQWGRASGTPSFSNRRIYPKCQKET